MLFDSLYFTMKRISTFSFLQLVFEYLCHGGRLQRGGYSCRLPSPLGNADAPEKTDRFIEPETPEDVSHDLRVAPVVE